MRKLVKHVILPLTGPALIVGLYFTPVETLGCANRGIAAICIAAVCTIAAVMTAIRSIAATVNGESDANWWTASTVIYLLPAALLLGPFG